MNEMRNSVFTGLLVAAWMKKAQSQVATLAPAITAAGGSILAVRAELVSNPRAAPYGRFMVAWPEGDTEPVIRHLSTAGFFLRLLELSYSDVLLARPDLARALTDGSRLELAITNDVLQVQAAAPPGRYSMVRHHALMHWAATDWLEPASRRRWNDLYEALAQHLMTDRVRPPDPVEVDEAEAAAFDDFERLGRQTWDDGSADELLADVGPLESICAYLRYAAVGIAVLERARAGAGSEKRNRWLSEQLVHGYPTADFLKREWTETLR